MKPSDTVIVRVAACVAAASWVIYVTTAGGSLATADAVSMYEQAKSIVDRGALDVPPSASTDAWRGRDGRHYVAFGIGQSLFDIPWLLVGRALAHGAGASPDDVDRVSKALVAIANTIPAAAAVGFGCLLAYELSGSVPGSLAAAVALGLGTLLWPHAKYGFNAPLTTVTLCAGVWAFARGATKASTSLLAFGGLAFGAALLTRHELALAGAAATGWLAVSTRGHRRRAIQLAWGSAGIVAAIAAWCVLNLVRFGDPLWTGYAPALSVSGVAGYAVSPSGALAVYSPIALAGLGLIRLARRGAPSARLQLAVVLVLGGFYCTLEDWLGTRSYGPRYLVPLLPLLVSPIAVWWRGAGRTRRAWIVWWIVLSTVAQLPPVLVNFSRAGIEAGQPPQSVRAVEWRWAPIVTTTRDAWRSVPRNIRYLTGAATPPPVSRSDPRSLEERLAFSLDFWWLYGFYLHAVPRAAALLALPTGLGIAAWLLRRAWVLSAGGPDP